MKVLSESHITLLMIGYTAAKKYKDWVTVNAYLDFFITNNIDYKSYINIGKEL